MQAWWKLRLDVSERPIDIREINAKEKRRITQWDVIKSDLSIDYGTVKFIAGAGGTCQASKAEPTLSDSRKIQQPR